MVGHRRGCSPGRRCASPAHALERLSLVGLVGGAIFQFATGIFNVQLYYPWHFNFVVAHYYGAWVFLAALTIHVAIKLPTMRRAFRERGVLAPLRADLAHRPEPHEPGSLAPPTPDAADASAAAASSRSSPLPPRASWW